MQLGQGYIGTEHLLLGLVREGEGVAATGLVSLGADLKRTRIGFCAPPFSGVRLRAATPAPSRFLLLCPR